LFTNKVEVFVRLMDEGITTFRPTEALIVGENEYKLLPSKNYDPSDEVWEFFPGTIVNCKKIQIEGVFRLIAIKEARRRFRDWT